MIKTILAPATGTDADRALFAAAVQTARHFGAHLDFLHVRPDPRDIAAALATDFAGGAASATLIKQLEEEAAQRAERARKSFDTLCEQQRLAVRTGALDPQAVSAQWHQETGDAAGWIAEYGRTSDLLMVGRPAEGGATGREMLEAALLDTGRPLLIPGAAVLPETIAIAWKSTREAAHAATAAAPFVAKAKRIVILTVAEDGGMDRDAGTRLFATLHRHNPATEVRHLQPDPRGTAETLLGVAAEIGAGLLVMGGYGHSRLREQIFGGVTEHVLRAAALPVLMAH